MTDLDHMKACLSRAENDNTKLRLQLGQCRADVDTLQRELAEARHALRTLTARHDSALVEIERLATIREAA